MPSLPPYDPKRNYCELPHVVILGAGASRAGFPNGDKHGFSLPLMNQLVEVVGLSGFFERFGYGASSDFESVFSDVSESGKYGEDLRELELKVRNYFEKLELPDTPTLYDYLILSLREKDLIASFNWDPLLIQAFARNAHLRRLPQVSFLHGNVGIGTCLSDKRAGYLRDLCSACMNPFDPVPLLYPVKEKNYESDPFIKSEWSRLASTLGYGYRLTIFGYSAPKTDVAAREVMLSKWRANPFFEMNEVEIVDIRSRADLEESWDEFLHSHHYSVSDDIRHSSLWRSPRRTCESLGAATLMCDPIRTVDLPEFETVRDLQNWIQLFIDEEIHDAQSQSGLCRDMKKVIGQLGAT